MLITVPQNPSWQLSLAQLSPSLLFVFPIFKKSPKRIVGCATGGGWVAVFSFISWMFREKYCYCLCVFCDLYMSMWLAFLRSA